jgi:hypothetical protein
MRAATASAALSGFEIGEKTCVECADMVDRTSDWVMGCFSSLGFKTPRNQGVVPRHPGGVQPHAGRKINFGISVVKVSPVLDEINEGV